MKKANTWALIGMACGVLTIIFGIIVIGMDETMKVSMNTAFGGDFYTYSYKATAYAVYNLDVLYSLVAKCFGFLLLSLGIFDICFFGLKIKKRLPDIPKDAHLEEKAFNDLPSL